MLDLFTSSHRWARRLASVGCLNVVAALLPSMGPAFAEDTLVVPPLAHHRPHDATQRIVAPVAQGEQRLKLLIISGENSYEHNWTAVNNLLRTKFTDTGRFDVRVVEDFSHGSLDMLEQYDAVLVNYFGRWNYTDPKEKRWSRKAEKALFDYARNGGGVIVYHASFGLGSPSWPEWERLAGGTMRPFKGSRKAPPNAFMVRIADTAHPITEGLREYHWALLEDMYTNMYWDPSAKINVLATAYEDEAFYEYRKAGPKYPPELYTPEKMAAMKGMNAAHPVVWTVDYGKGRVFCITLGHGPEAINSPGTEALILRGAEWAASGEVTIEPGGDAKAFVDVE